MITFNEYHYAWLFAVALPFISITWAVLWRKSRRAHERFMPQTQRIHERPTRKEHAVALAIFDLLLAAILILGLMHPTRHYIAMEIVYEHAATIMLVDNSSSMKAEAGYFGQGGRLGAVKRALQELLLAQRPSVSRWRGIRDLFSFQDRRMLGSRLMEGQRVGIVTFAGFAISDMPPTTRQGTLLSVTRLIQPVSNVSYDGTNFPGALEESLALFTKDDRVRVIVLFTDGEEEGSALPIEPMLAKAAAERVRIFPVLVGRELAPVPGKEGILTKPDTALAKVLASRTGGEWFSFDERGKLYPILAKIFSEVEEASREPVTKRQNLQPWCALLFLTLATTRIFATYLIDGQRPIQKPA